MEDNAWHVYLAECADGTLYCGIAKDPVKRMAEHNGDLPGGARYTRGRRPVILLASKACASKSDALKLERVIKASPRRKKMSFMRPDEFICKRCGRCCSGKGNFSFHGSVTAEDYAEIAKTAPSYVLKWFDKLPYIGSYDYFVSPITGNAPQRCPCLKKNGVLFSCVIHHCKPPVCKAFPLDAEQIRTAPCGCRGLEHLDKP